SLNVFSNVARFSGGLTGALQAVRESRAIAERTADPNDHTATRNLDAALWREALILGEFDNISLNRPQEAVPLLERAFDIAQDLARRDANDYSSRTYVSMTGIELGDLLRDSDPGRALAVYDETRDRIAEVKNNAKMRRDEASLLAASSYVLRRLRRPAESKERIDAAFTLLSDLKDYPAARVEPGGQVDGTVRALADHYADTGELSAAISTYEDLLEKVRASNPQPKSDLRHAWGLTRIYRDLGNLH